MSTPTLNDSQFTIYVGPLGWRIALTDTTNPLTRAWVDVDTLDAATQAAVEALLPALLAAGFPTPTST